MLKSYKKWGEYSEYSVRNIYEYLQEIAEKVPKGCDAAYVKTEENRIYWVKEEETGFEDIW